MVVTVRTNGAMSCRLIAVGRPVVVVKLSRAWKHCSAGIYHQAIIFGANLTPTVAVQSFRFYARHGAISIWRRVSVKIKGVSGVAAFATSENWAGYIVPATALPIFSASGQWTVPALNCTDTPSAGASEWVGIGGQGWATGGSSGDLLQTGVTTSCVGGTQQNGAWWELMPSNPNYANYFTDFPISTGDAMEAGVYQLADGSWETRVDDLTTGVSGWMITGASWGVGADSSPTFTEQGLTTDLSYSGGYTAEWIVEDYTSNGSETPLANFGTITFSNLLINVLSGSSYPLTASDGTEIVQKGVLLALPSLPTSGGFSVRYTGP